MSPGISSNFGVCRTVLTLILGCTASNQIKFYSYGTFHTLKTTQRASQRLKTTMIKHTNAPTPINTQRDTKAQVFSHSQKTSIQSVRSCYVYAFSRSFYSKQLTLVHLHSCVRNPYWRKYLSWRGFEPTSPT